jgi:hypothetical protein
MKTKRKLVVTALCWVMILAAIPAVAGEIVMTVKGTVTRDSHDTLGIFQEGESLEGKPFTLTITFDDAGGTTRSSNLGINCVMSLLDGTSANPAKAVLTIGKGSYVFGTKPESKWDAYKDTAPNCPSSGIGFHVMEGAMPQTSNLRVTLQAGVDRYLKSGASWHDPIPNTKVYGIPGLGSFNITRPGDGNHAAWGRLDTRWLSISPANATTANQSADAETDSDSSSGKQDNDNPAAASGNPQSSTPAPHQSLKEKLRKAMGVVLPKVTIPNP